jgi:threonine dehydrogenase-like Zn-dependent dehydrogenase
VRVEPETRVAVVGDGKLGLLCAQALKATGAGVTLVGRHDSKLEIARGRGVRTLKAGELPDSYARAFDVAVEASGSPAGIETALRLLRPRGTLVLKSTFHGTTELNAAPVVVDEISIIGSRCGRFPAALELLRRDAVEVDALVSEEFPLSEGVRAMERAAAPGVLKVFIRM